MAKQPALFEAKVNSSQVDFLAGLITRWRYGEKPSKAQKEEGAKLAIEFGERIQLLP